MTRVSTRLVRKGPPRESATVAATRRALVKRMKAIGAERDLLRDLARDASELTATCDEALDALESAIECLSRYV